MNDHVELQRLAHRDALTGLPNRLKLERSVQRALRGNQRGDDRICLLYIDPDEFKQVNNRFTHIASQAARRCAGIHGLSETRCDFRQQQFAYAVPPNLFRLRISFYIRLEFKQPISLAPRSLGWRSCKLLHFLRLN